MKLINTGDPSNKPPVVMVVYGEGGVGKTTFASTAPKPILADCEGGSKYFGLRGIKMDVAQIEKWADMKEFGELVVGDKYETVIIDPIGELMEKLLRYMQEMKDAKLVQRDGNPTMAGWGWLKQVMRRYLKMLRDTGKNVIIIAHIAEDKDEDRLIKRPALMTKLSDELVNMVDIVGYMTVARGDEGEEKRIIMVDAAGDKFVSKDRTGRLGKYIEPDFTKIVDACQGTKEFSWTKPIEPPKEEPPQEQPGNSSGDKTEPEKPAEESSDDFDANWQADKQFKEDVEAKMVELTLTEWEKVAVYRNAFGKPVVPSENIDWWKLNAYLDAMVGNPKILKEIRGKVKSGAAEKKA